MAERFAPITVKFPKRRPIRDRISRWIDKIIIRIRGPRQCVYTGSFRHNLHDPRNWRESAKPRCGDTIVLFDLVGTPTDDPHDHGDEHEERE